MRDLIIGIQEDIQLGVLCFADIARKHNVPVSWVDEAWDMLCEQEAQEELHSLADSWYDEQYELNEDYL